MKKLKAIFAISMGVGFAGAVAPQAHAATKSYSTTQMQCDKIRQLIKQKGVVYLRDRDGRTSRYTNDVRYCPSTRSTGYTKVRSKDKKYCTVTWCSDADPYHQHWR